MDPMLLDGKIGNNDYCTNNKSSSDIIITVSSPQPNNHHPCYSCCSSKGTFLIDNVTNSMIGVDTWIAQELDRLSHNYFPRNCSNYEALLSVVEGYYQIEPHSNSAMCKGWGTHHSNSQQCTLLSQTQHEHKDTQATTTTINDEQLTQKNLILAFTKLIKYSQSNETVHAEHRQKPLKLLYEMEKMCHALWQNEKETTDDMMNFQSNLGHVLFGANIPIAKHLVSSWTLICLWVQQDISSLKKQQKWSTFGTYSYQIAKKFCSVGYHK